MEPQEQGGVALGSASAVPEASPGTITEGGGGLGQRAARQHPGEQSAPRPWTTSTSREHLDSPGKGPGGLSRMCCPCNPTSPPSSSLDFSLEAELPDGIQVREWMDHGYLPVSRLKDSCGGSQDGGEKHPCAISAFMKSPGD